MILVSEAQLLGIVGAGTMGAGIAQAAARGGVASMVVEADPAARERARTSITVGIEKAHAKGLLSTSVDEALQSITWVDDVTALTDVTVVIEAIPEIREAKGQLFGMLDEVCSPKAILATNTSSIPIAAIASATKHPERVIGLHFFNPVPVMPLVEVIPSLLTSEEITLAAEKFIQDDLGKQTIRAKDQAGFVVNAIFVPYLLSAIRAFENGVASAEDIDAGMVGGCGMPMGPLALCDLIGLDTMLLVADSLHAEYHDAATIAPSLLRRHVDAGYLGKKSGRGFYDYPDSSKKG